MQELNKKKFMGVVLFVLLMLGQNVFAITVDPAIQINYSRDKMGNVQAELMLNNIPKTSTALQVQIDFRENPIDSNFAMGWSSDIGSNSYKTMKVIENGSGSSEVILYLVSDSAFAVDGNAKLGTISFKSTKEINEVVSEMGYIKVLHENMKSSEYNCKVILKNVGTDEDNGSGDDDNSGGDSGTGDGGSSNNNGSTDSDSADGSSDKVEVIKWQEMKDVDKNKTFTITFSKEISSKEDFSKYIKVYDSNRKLVSCEFNVIGNKVKVIPKKVYESQQTYTMEISEKIKSYSGKPLNKKIVLKFTIK